MNCPDCDNERMVEEVEYVDFYVSTDLIEITFECPGCGIVFSGTLYRGPI